MIAYQDRTRRRPWPPRQPRGDRPTRRPSASTLPRMNKVHTRDTCHSCSLKLMSLYLSFVESNGGAFFRARIVIYSVKRKLRLK